MPQIHHSLLSLHPSEGHWCGGGETNSEEDKPGRGRSRSLGPKGEDASATSVKPLSRHGSF